MRPRDFLVMCQAYLWQYKRRQTEMEHQAKGRVTLAALMTTELANIFAAPYAPKGWKPFKHSDFLDAWMGNKTESKEAVKKDPGARLQAEWEEMSEVSDG